MARRGSRHGITPAARPQPSLPWYEVAVGCACAAFVFLAARDSLGFVRILLFPVELNFGEGVLQYEALRLARGLPIYKPLGEPPYWFSTYPPLYQLLGSLWTSCGLLWLRLISLASSTFTVMAACTLVFWLARDWRPACLAGLMWITSGFVDSWAAVARVDMLGRALQCLAVLAAWRWPDKRGAFWTAVVACTLAMLTKQTLVAGGLTCVAWYWWRWGASRRQALLFGAAWAGLTLASYGVLALVTRGCFWRNLFVDAARPMQWSILGAFIINFVEMYWAPIVLAAFAVRSAWTDPRQRVVIVALVAGLPSVALAANDGADVNYFFDLIWPLCVLAALGTWRVVQDKAWKRTVAALALGVYALLLAVLPMPTPAPQDTEMARKIVAALAAAPGPILTELPGYTLAAGKEPEYLPYMYKKLEERGAWDPSPIAGKIRSHGYSAVLVTQRMAQARLGRSLLQALEANYLVADQFPGMYLVEGPTTLQLLVPASSAAER